MDQELKKIREQNEYKIQREQNNYKEEEPGVHLGSLPMVFRKKKFYEDEITLYIPKDFEEMPENLKIQKYPNINRPEMIQTNAKGDVNFTWNYKDIKLEESELESLLDDTEKMLKMIQPSMVFYKKEVKEIEAGKIAILDYKSPAIGGKIYNYNFFLKINDKILQGVFNCRYNECKMWKPIFEEVVNHINTELEDSAEELENELIKREQQIKEKEKTDSYGNFFISAGRSELKMYYGEEATRASQAGRAKNEQKKET